MKYLCAIAAICLLAFGGSDALICRSGFNTSIAGMPISYWNESYPCPSSSPQSCFLGEIEYEDLIKGQNVAVTYGSCITKAYSSYLACETLFGEEGLDVDNILQLMPDLGERFMEFIGMFSEQLAEQITMHFQNGGQNMNRTEILHMILAKFNKTIPEGIKPILVKLDNLIEVASMSNESLIELAVDELLMSISSLNTTNQAASQLLYDFFAKMNITVPDKFKPLIDNLPGFISQHFKGNNTFAMMNGTIFKFLSLWDTSDPSGSWNAILDEVASMWPEKMGSFIPFLRSLPNLVTAIMSDDEGAIGMWGLELLKMYSRITPATEAVSNSTFELLKRLGLYDNLTDESITQIIYQPGTIYNYIEDETQADYILYNISAMIDNIMPEGGYDLMKFFDMINVSFDGMEHIVSVLQKLIDAASTGDGNIFGQVALEALKNGSTLTEASVALSRSIISYIEQFNVTLEPQYEEIIYYFPGLFNTVFSNHTDMISMIYWNISQELDSINITHYDFQKTMDDLLDSLQMAGIVLPEDTIAVIRSLPEFIMAIIYNDTAAVDQWIQMAMQSVIGPETQASTELSDTIKNMVMMYTGEPLDLMTDMLISHLVRIPYKYFPDNATLIDMIYNNITDGIKQMNMTTDVAMQIQQLFDMYNITMSPQLALFLEYFPEIQTALMSGNSTIIGMVFQELGMALAEIPMDTSMIPPEFLPLLNATESLIAAIMQNDTQAVMVILSGLSNQYCTKNEVTQAFASAMYNELVNKGMMIAPEYEAALECIPGLLFTFLPNKTETLTTVFTHITQATTNLTAYIGNVFADMGLEPTHELLVFVEYLPEMSQAIISGNSSEIYMVMKDFIMALARETEYSKLIETVLTKLGVNVTEEIRLNIQLQAIQLYYQIGNMSDIVDSIFASLNEDIAAGNDIGLSIIEALEKENIAIPPEALPFLNNIQSVIDAVMGENDAEVYMAVINMLEAYNSSFPSPHLELQIYIWKLELAFVTMNGTDIPDEVYIQLGNIFMTALEISGTTPEEFKAMLEQNFPDLMPFIGLLSNLEAHEVISLGSDFLTWLLDPDRNATTLAMHINATLHILVDRLGIDIKSILKEAVQPDFCKYETCDTDSCNGPELLVNTTVVTPKPDPTTTVGTDQPDISTITGTDSPPVSVSILVTGTNGETQPPGTGNPNTGNPNTANPNTPNPTTATPIVTTSDAGLIVKKSASPLFLIISFILSLNIAYL